MPGALHGAADHHAIDERTAAMRAAVVERDPTVFGASQDNPCIIDVQKLHLIQLELVRCCHNDGFASRRLDVRLVPLAGTSIPVINTDLIAADQGAAHPAT